MQIRDCPIICTDLQSTQRSDVSGCFFSQKWPVLVSSKEKNLYTQKCYLFYNPICSRVQVFFCRECSDLGVGGWVSTNLNLSIRTNYWTIRNNLEIIWKRAGCKDMNDIHNGFAQQKWKYYICHLKCVIWHHYHVHFSAQRGKKNKNIY